MATDRFGIDDRYHDALGAEHQTSAETRAAILVAMGVSADALSPPKTSVWVLRPTDDRTLKGPARLTLEDGTVLSVDGALPPDLPFGYHALAPRPGQSGGDADDPSAATQLIVTPGKCHLPDDLRTWGLAVQVYATRSRDSWGIGDLADLRRIARWSHQTLGARVMMINPLSAATPLLPVEASPYYPSSRRFRSPLFLRVEEVPGAQQLGSRLEALAAAGRALNADRRIDRDAVFRLKTDALQTIFDQFPGAPDFDRYRTQQGEALTQFATYCALAERHGRDWRQWPAAYRRSDDPAVARFATDEAQRVRFHAWLQWLIEGQLARASDEIGIIHDLPIGLDVAGADAWCWQDLMAKAISVGAPPDQFNHGGQDWGLAPFVPHVLRAQRYRPFIETIRAMLSHAGGLRIDHVMGLFRLFWIPHALGAAGGTYVRYDADALLAIIAIESHRAGAFIVGEDLGTVEDGVRHRLAENNMLSYRLMYFEPHPPREYPELALSSVTTHDLATIAGVWTGRDVADSKAAGLSPNEDGLLALRHKLAEAADIPDDAPVEEAIVKTYQALATAPSRVLLATLDDAIAVPERPNMPGTTTAWPNWSLALPQTIEQIEQSPLPRRVAAALTRA